MDYALHLSVLVLLWAGLGLSQGLITGYLGVLAVHQAAAWAIGAYAAALLNKTFGLPLAATLLPAAFAATVCISGMTMLVAKGRQDTQVVASLCVQVVIIGLLVNLGPWTGGPSGLSGIGAPDASQRLRALEALAGAAVVLAAAGGVYVALARTRAVGAWQLIRDDRAFAESLGYDAGRSRLIASGIAAALAGASGAVFAYYFTFIEPNSFGLPESVAILTVAVIGGAPNPVGVCIAAAVIVLAPELLRVLSGDLPQAANLKEGLFGLLLIFAIARRGRARHRA